jgi:hypothetical protein
VTKKATAALIDLEDTAGRTTATLATRLGALYFISGADAIASLTSGFAALGCEVSKITEGARLREAPSRSLATDMLPGVPAHRRRSTLCNSEPGPRPTPQRCCRVARGRSATNLRLDANSRPMKTKKPARLEIQCLQGRLSTCFRCSASFTQPRAFVNWKK